MGLMPPSIVSDSFVPFSAPVAAALMMLHRTVIHIGVIRAHCVSSARSADGGSAVGQH